MGRSPRRGLGVRGAALFAVLMAALAGWLLLQRRGGSIQEPGEGEGVGLLGAIPADALIVAVVDLTALRQTSFGAELLGKGRTVAGLGGVVEICGSDPMAGISSLAVAVPGSTRDQSFGVFASGEVDADLLIGCAERVVARRGGRPVRQARGRFSLLRDASLELSSAMLAAAAGGPVLLAEPPYVDAALALLQRGGASVASDPTHGQLRELVEPGLLLVTAVLSDEQRQTLRSELKLQGMADSPFGSLRAGALSVRLEGLLMVHAVLRCASAPACSQVAAAIDRARGQEAATAAAQVVGLSKVLDGVSIVAEGDAVHLRLAVPPETVMTLVNRMLALRRLGQDAAPATSETAPLPSGAVERIEARPAASAPPPGSSSPPRPE